MQLGFAGGGSGGSGGVGGTTPASSGDQMYRSHGTATVHACGHCTRSPCPMMLTFRGRVFMLARVRCIREVAGRLRGVRMGGAWFCESDIESGGEREGGGRTPVAFSIYVVRFCLSTPRTATVCYSAPVPARTAWHVALCVASSRYTVFKRPSGPRVGPHCTARAATCHLPLRVFHPQPTVLHMHMVDASMPSALGNGADQRADVITACASGRTAGSVDDRAVYQVF